MKAAERESQRRYKADQKRRVASEAADAVDDWKQEINDLISIHADLADAINWHKLVEVPKPKTPSNFTKHREQIAPKLKNFKPKMFDFLFGGTEKRKTKLIASFEAAKLKDQTAQEKAKLEHETALQDWEDETSMAKRVLAGDAHAAHQVVSEMQTVTDQAIIGKKVNFKFDQNFVHAITEVHSDDIVPNYRRKQLASGKLSETKMPVGEFNELYQDYVASAALKIAGDLFHILPHPEIYVTCTSMMLDTQTGYQKPTPILSAQFVRETFMRLNIAMVDPSDALENFNHVMNFKRAKGFNEIKPMHPIEEIK